MTTPALRLHQFPLSGHCHRVSLMLSLLDLPHEQVFVDLAAGAQKRPEFLALNALGQVPVLQVGERGIADSNAILLYLAGRHDPSGRWLPQTPEAQAALQRWFSLAASWLQQGPATLRATRLFGRTAEPAIEQRAHALALALFSHMERTLTGAAYLLGDDPSLADVAMYSYTSVAGEGGLSLQDYPQIRAWLARIEAWPRFLPMPRAGA